jgi:hypothetical protein
MSIVVDERTKGKKKKVRRKEAKASDRLVVFTPFSHQNKVVVAGNQQTNNNGNIITTYIIL